MKLSSAHAHFIANFQMEYTSEGCVLGCTCTIIVCVKTEVYWLFDYLFAITKHS